MTKSSKEYLNTTEDDMLLWHYSSQAKNTMEMLSKGYDVEDTKATGSQLGKKYTPDILEQKGINFRNLKLSEQKDILFTSLTGKETEVVRKRREGLSKTVVMHAVFLLLKTLQSIDKLDDWTNKSDYHSFKFFKKLSLKNMEVYHNELVKFHDEQLRKQSPNPSTPQVSALSPEPVIRGLPNFDDSTKWEKQ